MVKQALSKEAFKARWESNANGGGITFNDIADCAVAWGVIRAPKAAPIAEVSHQVLKAAGCVDAKAYAPKAEADQ